MLNLHFLVLYEPFEFVLEIKKSVVFFFSNFLALAIQTILLLQKENADAKQIFLYLRQQFFNLD